MRPASAVGGQEAGAHLGLSLVGPPLPNLLSGRVGFTWVLWMKTLTWLVGIHCNRDPAALTC